MGNAHSRNKLLLLGDTYLLVHQPAKEGDQFLLSGALLYHRVYTWTTRSETEKLRLS